jgi:xanthine dehydrogenase molybdopterin-binding subunit B
METKGRMESDMSEYEIIGKPLPRIDGFEKVTGQAKYTVDRVMPGMLHGKFIRSPHPHARLLSINTEKAKKLRGGNDDGPDCCSRIETHTGRYPRHLR